MRRTSRRIRRNSRRRSSDKLRDMEVPMVFGYELDREKLVPVKRHIDLSTGDYGCDPIGPSPEGFMFRMVPSGDIVTEAERDRRLKLRKNGDSRRRSSRMRSNPSMTTSRGYVRVDGPGVATLFLPSGGRWAGGEVPGVVVSRTADPGWYTASFMFTPHGRYVVQLSKKVDPRKEAQRLRALAAGNVGVVKAREPGIAGHQQRAGMQTESKRAAKYRAEYYARLLDKYAP